MEGDRIESLERRLEAFEHTLFDHQTKQERQHGEVQQQIGQLRHHVDQQACSMQQHLDAKMSEQLSHIERLLTANAESSKKSRME